MYNVHDHQPQSLQSNVNPLPTPSSVPCAKYGFLYGGDIGDLHVLRYVGLGTSLALVVLNARTRMLHVHRGTGFAEVVSTYNNPHLLHVPVPKFEREVQIWSRFLQQTNKKSETISEKGELILLRFATNIFPWVVHSCDKQQLVELRLVFALCLHFLFFFVKERHFFRVYD